MRNEKEDERREGRREGEMRNEEREREQWKAKTVEKQRHTPGSCQLSMCEGHPQLAEAAQAEMFV